MKTIFLETNAINKCITNGLDGKRLAKLLKDKNLHPVVSLHTTYELARTFSDDKKTEIGKKLFLFLKDLNPIYSCETQTLLRREISRLREEETDVNYHIESRYEAPLHNAINMLSNGEVAE